MPTWTTTRKKFYACTGSQVIFPFTFPIGSQDDIVVKVRTDATGAVVTLELTTDYTVSNASGNWDSGGSVTTVATYAVGETLLIKRVTPKTQTKDYLEGDDFPAESHEEGIDKLTRIVQELQEEVWRCIKMPDTDDVDLDMEMPGAIDRAGRWLGFDAAGEPTIINIIRLYAILDFMVTFLESADAEAACDVLGIPTDDIHYIDDVGEPAFQNGWANEGGAYEPCGFYKDIDGFLHIFGRATGGLAGTVIFTLPVDYRPGKTIFLPSPSEADCYIQINNSGEVSVVSDQVDHADIANIGTNTHAQIDTHIADTAYCKIQTLTYTGDGSTSYHIDTNIHPIYVRIWPRNTIDADSYIFETTDTIVDDSASGMSISVSDRAYTRINRIISLDTDGFTVDDAGADEHPNKSGQVYNVFVWGY